MYTYIKIVVIKYRLYVRTSHLSARFPQKIKLVRTKPDVWIQNYDDLYIKLRTNIDKSHNWERRPRPGTNKAHNIQIVQHGEI